MSALASNCRGTARTWMGTLAAEPWADRDLTYQVQQMGCFGYDHEHQQLLWKSENVMAAKGITWIMFTYENNEDGDYPHFHIIAHYNRPVRMTQFKADFNSGDWHCEKVASVDAAVAYLRGLKQGEEKGGYNLYPPTEWGTRPVGQGKRTDLDKLYDLMKKPDCQFIDLLQASPKTFIQYSSGISKALSVLRTPAIRSTPEVYWFTGASGSGKTSFSITLCTEKGWNAYIRTPELGNWWDGYETQDTIIFDDFNWADNNCDGLLRLIDRQPATRQIKGGTVAIRAHRFIFTGHIHWSDLYTQHTKYEDWCRRMHEFMKLERNFDERPFNPANPYAPNEFEI